MTAVRVRTLCDGASVVPTDWRFQSMVTAVERAALATPLAARAVAGYAVPTMHKSRLATIVIDTPDADYPASASFWSAALGKEIMATESPRYDSLKGRVGGDGGPYLLLQRVAPEERAIHLDIETDDVEAEVARLEKLGARIKARIRNHVVMVAPSGHPFCVVPVYRQDFLSKAREWP